MQQPHCLLWFNDPELAHARPWFYYYNGNATGRPDVVARRSSFKDFLPANQSSSHPVIQPTRERREGKRDKALWTDGTKRTESVLQSYPITLLEYDPMPLLFYDVRRFALQE